MGNPYIKRPLRTAATVFDYAAPELVAYENVAKKRLAQIIENLELGEDANLGLHRSMFKPDDSAEIEFNVSPGILEPIIRVTIRFPNEAAGGGKKRDERESKKAGFMWLGVQMIDHAVTDYSAFTFGTMARVNGFEPEIDGQPLTFSQCVEPCPVPYQQPGGQPFGAYQNYVDEYDEEEVLSRTTEDKWVNSLNLESLNCLTGVTPNPDYVYDEVLQTCTGDIDCPQYCSSNFNFQAQCLENNLVMCASRSGMVLFPAYLTPWFAPPGAYNAVEAGGDPLPRDYWGQSILIDGENGAVWSYEDGFPETITEHVRLLGAAGVTYQNLKVEEFNIPCEVLGGEYVFHFWSEGYPCDEVPGVYHARLILGGGSEKWQEEVDIETNSDTGEAPRILAGPSGTVVDIYPQGIGGLFPASRGLYTSDTTLGGDGWFAKNVPDHGYCTLELRVNVEAGTWRLAVADYKQPFYCPTCERSPAVIRDDPNGCGSICDGIAWGDADYAPLSSGRDQGGWALPCLYLNTPVQWVDIRGLYLWQLARVLQVTTVATQAAPVGAICAIQLVGFDGMPNTSFPCSCQPYGYGGVFKGVGIADTVTYEPIGGFQVGDLVGVYAVMGSCTEFGHQPDTTLAVVRPKQLPEWDFLGDSARERICIEYVEGAYDQFARRVSNAAAIQIEGNELQPTASARSLRFECVNGRVQSFS